MNVAPYGGDAHQPAMPRPQVGIERLPTRRMSNEPRESMNCKSCRKRKIKCNRLRPACEACQVFQCPCVYDAVPKKRGPKTDVLEALLKRVDGLEAKLKEKNQGEGSGKVDDEISAISQDIVAATEKPAEAIEDAEPNPKRQNLESVRPPAEVATVQSPLYTSPPVSEHTPSVHEDALLDLYFQQFHAKPYYILDESSIRHRLQLNQIPNYLLFSVYSLSARYSEHPSGKQAALKLSRDYALRSRSELDVDEPSIDAIQALLLLVLSFTSSGKGRKAFMLLTSAVGMAMALELHREVDVHANITPLDREMRRRLFWTCYLLDRFMACGSKRPCLIGDGTIILRMPCWSTYIPTVPTEGEFFQSNSNFQYLHGNGKKSQGSMGILIDISRILGNTNRYLAAGGVKGDSHFPWHSLSNLSKIRHELDIWASGIESIFSSLDGLFGQPDSCVLVLGKLIYHLVHCLIYRPFLPIDLSELSGTGQHQSWQIEATSMCFLHANAIGELVELGKTTSIIWPGFVGYCVATAGTVHVHGAHYNRNGMNGQMSVCASSSEFLSREIQQLCELRYSWASVQHQRETLQSICTAHAELVRCLADHPMRYSPVFHLEDFFDRYSDIGGPGGKSFAFDHAYLSLSDVIVDFNSENQQLSPNQSIVPSYKQERPNLKRKITANTDRTWSDRKDLSPINTMHNNPITHAPGIPTPNSHPQQYPLSMDANHSQLPHNDANNATASQPDHGSRPINRHHPPAVIESTTRDMNPATSTPMAGPPPPTPHQPPQPSPQQAMPALSNSTATTAYSPAFNYTNPQNGSVGSGNMGHPGSHSHQHHHQFDPMFGGVPTNTFSSPAAWPGDDDQHAQSHVHQHLSLQHHQFQQQQQQQQQQRSHITSPSGGLPHGAHLAVEDEDEKDPFLSLLEQLADNEMGQGSELDAFLAGAHG